MQNYGYAESYMLRKPLLFVYCILPLGQSESIYVSLAILISTPQVEKTRKKKKI